MNTELLRAEIQARVKSYLVHTILEKSAEMHKRYWRVCSCAECQLKRRYTELNSKSHPSQRERLRKTYRQFRSKYEHQSNGTLSRR